VTGDLINKAGDAAQIGEYKRIAGQIDPRIRFFSVAGNHDVGNGPTAESLAKYRKLFGPDYYTFPIGDIIGVVLDSSIPKNEDKVPEEAKKMEAWLRAELTKAKQEPGKRVIVFQHIPWFLKDPKEADQYFNIPLAARQRYLKLLHEFGVQDVFAGHLH